MGIVEELHGHAFHRCIVASMGPQFRQSWWAQSGKVKMGQAFGTWLKFYMKELKVLNERVVGIGCHATELEEFWHAQLQEGWGNRCMGNWS